MKKCSFILVFIFFTMYLAAQSDWSDMKYFVKYKYSGRGADYFRVVNPYENSYYDNFRYYKSYSEHGNNIGFGFRTSKNLFIVTSLSINSNSFSFGSNDQSIKSEISLLTITPYIGLKNFIFKKEKVGSFFQLGLSNRFSFANTDNYVNDESKKEFEQAIEDMTSPFRIFGEMGIEYFFTPNLSFGISYTSFLEFLNGESIIYDYYEDQYLIFDFSETNLGQFINLNLIIYF